MGDMLTGYLKRATHKQLCIFKIAFFCKSIKIRNIILSNKNVKRELLGSSYTKKEKYLEGFCVKRGNILLFFFIISLQSLEDTQVGYILQKYTLDRYTLEKYTSESFWIFLYV